MRPVLFALLLTACAVPPLAPIPEGRPDAAPADCPAACARMTELGCPEAEPTPEGGTCVEVCTNAETTPYARLRPDCVMQIEDCTQLDGCVYGW